MAEKSSKGVLETVYIILLVMAILMHMSVSGLQIGSLFAGIFTSLDGILIFWKAVLGWMFDFLFRAETIYKIGLIIILWFVGLPALTRYRIIHVSSSLMLSIIITLYVFLSLRLFDVMRY